jgi:hypothetical protein
MRRRTAGPGFDFTLRPQAEKCKLRGRLAKSPPFAVRCSEEAQPNHHREPRRKANPADLRACISPHEETASF